MPKKTNKTNPYDIIRQLAGATHLEVQYFLPHARAWLPNPSDPMLVDMDSVAIGLLFTAVDNLLFVPQSKDWTQ